MYIGNVLLLILQSPVAVFAQLRACELRHVPAHPGRLHGGRVLNASSMFQLGLLAAFGPSAT
jgi:hypothetical protein